MYITQFYWRALYSDGVLSSLSSQPTAAERKREGPISTFPGALRLTTGRFHLHAAYTAFWRFSARKDPSIFFPQNTPN